MRVRNLYGDSLELAAEAQRFLEDRIQAVVSADGPVRNRAFLTPAYALFEAAHALHALQRPKARHPDDPAWEHTFRTVAYMLARAESYLSGQEKAERVEVARLHERISALAAAAERKAIEEHGS